jgi:uncharacterized membrane protein
MKKHIIDKLQEKIKETEKIWNRNLLDSYKCSYYNSVVSTCEECIVIMENNNDLMHAYREIEQDVNCEEFIEDRLDDTTIAILKGINEVKYETLNMILDEK